MMRAMILAAGRGERMRPLTDTIPKPLLKVAGQSLIEYQIQRLVTAGITQIVINHAYLGEQIERTLADGQRYGAHLLYSPENPIVLGTGGGIYRALPLLGTEPFIVVNGDVYCDYPLQHLPKQLLGLAHLILVNNPNHHPKGDFHLQANQVLESGEPRFTFSGIGVYHPALFTTCEPGPFPLGPLLKSVMSSGQVTGEYYSGYWLDVGTPERLQELERYLLLR